ncbi:MAG: 2-oxo acid dehydrogenase subunit E2 [Planctomycetes bacterium]|nr:2-oxo acid dehydrogenase subunit E2 [Planctomycetota bacterium]
MGYQRQELRGFRKIANAMWRAPSDGTIYGYKAIDVTLARAFQAQVKERYDVWPSIGQLVGRAIALALTQVPDGNTKLIWGRPYVKDTVDVYFQVDLGDGQDLSGVVVTDVGKKNPVQVATELREVSHKLRSGKDKQYEKTQKGCLGRMPTWLLRRMLGFFTFLEYNLGITPTWLGARPEPFGTVMVTNVSKFGVDVAYAPLVPVSRVPFVALVGQIADRPWVVDGELTIRPVINVSATFDHRLLDGNKIGKIVRSVVNYLENPFPHEAELGLTPPEVKVGRLREGGAQDPGAEGSAPEPSEPSAEE